jgi:Na+/melibiose symporter-like transporter
MHHDGNVVSRYVMNFIWGFSPRQVGVVAASMVLSAAAAFRLAPRLSRALGKRRAAMRCGAASAFFASAPMFLWLAGLAPTGGQARFAFVLGMNVADVACGITTQILITSMLADTVDDAEVRTGRRAEGVVFGVQTFVRKSVSGLGTLTAGLLLSAASFPTGKQPGEVPLETVRRLASLVAPLQLLLPATALWLLSHYRLDRRAHEKNVALLRRAQEAGVQLRAADAASDADAAEPRSPLLRNCASP